jgi:tetrahydromethanopterin S-methyltransferase subunit G
MTDPPNVWTTRDMIQDLRVRVDQLEQQVDKVMARMNMAVGGMVVLGSLALVNLVVNVIQTASGVK